MSNKTIDITTLPGYSSLDPGTYTITARASAVGKAMSDPSAGVSYTKGGMPTKGQIINLDMDGNGNAQYRVLKVNGSNVEVVSMDNVCYTQKFITKGNNTYAGSDLDTYLNSTYYNTLTTAAKSAIVDKTFAQDNWWHSGIYVSGSYIGKFGTTKPGTQDYYILLDTATYGSSITRHIYALSVQDVLDYVKDTSIGDGELQNYNIWKMFWNDEVTHKSDYNSLWLCSAYTAGGYTTDAYYINGVKGKVSYGGVNFGYGVRAAFTIDLSKISWS